MIVVILVVLGLCFGSFVNALVWRVHEQAQKSRKSKVKSQKYSILQGRSMCPNCLHTLAWYDLIPLVSWLQLGGKCRYCQKPISWQYPLVELITAFLFVFSYVFWPYSSLISHLSSLFVFWLIFLTGFVALAIYDLRWMLLPDRIVWPLQVLAAAYVGTAALFFHGGWQTIQGALIGVLCIAGLFYGLFQVSRGKWIGGGDVKLAVILGLLVGGPAKALLVIFIASLIGSIFGIPLLLKGKAKVRIPFGPFLIIAAIVVYLFGTSLIAWYKTKLIIT